MAGAATSSGEEASLSGGSAGAASSTAAASLSFWLTASTTDASGDPPVYSLQSRSTEHAASGMARAARNADPRILKSIALLGGVGAGAGGRRLGHLGRRR